MGTIVRLKPHGAFRREATALRRPPPAARLVLRREGYRWRDVSLRDRGPDADQAVVTGYKAARNRPLTRGQKLSNKALAAVRAPVEHGFARLKNRRVLGKVRTDPKWATAPVRALLVLTNCEVAR
ncbi:transposase family protein [Streptomyces mirabilis]|uniref:transposase family protein n=1 Tax=Streptomyces mirabilis TaxID=68239 RepID=UPI0033311364